MIMNRFPPLSVDGSSQHAPLFTGDYLSSRSLDGRETTPEINDLPPITDANLYIKNIDYDISDDTLFNVFSKYGEIIGHHIVRDAMKRSRGFGFMSYRRIDEARTAILEANGKFIGNKPVIVMLHIKKDQRRMQKLVMKENLSSVLPRDFLPTNSFKLQHAMHLYQSNLVQRGSARPGHSYGSGPLTGPYSKSMRDLDSPYRDMVIGTEYSSPDSGYFLRKPSMPTWDEKMNHNRTQNTQDNQHGYLQTIGTHTSYPGPANHFPLQKKMSHQDMFDEGLQRQMSGDSFDGQGKSQGQGHSFRHEHQYDSHPNQLGGNQLGGNHSHGSSQGSSRSGSIISVNGQWVERGVGEGYSQTGSPRMDQWAPGSPPNQDQTYTPRGNAGISLQGLTSGPSGLSGFDHNSFSNNLNASIRQTSVELREHSNSPPLSYTDNMSDMTNNNNMNARRFSLPDERDRSHPFREGPNNITPLNRPSSGSLQGSIGSPLGSTMGSLYSNPPFSQTIYAEAGAQRVQLTARLLPLVEARSNHARQITEYLILHAPFTELLQLLETPELLLPHYIAAAVTKMTSQL